MLDSYLDTEKIKYVSKTHLPYTFSAHAVSLRYVTMPNCHGAIMDR